jgi:competence protein ComGF
VLEIQSAFKRCLKIPSNVKGHVQLTKCKRWKKVEPLLKLYLMDLLKVRIMGTLQILSDKAPLEMLLSDL